MSFSTRRSLSLILRITLFWTIVALIQYLIGYGTLIELGIDLTDIEGNIWIGFHASLIAGVLAGLLGGAMLVLAWESWLRSVSYRQALTRIFLSYTLIFMIVAFCSILYSQSNNQNLSFTDTRLWELAIDRLFSLNTFVPYFFWLIVVLITQIGLLVNDKYGPGVFTKFLLGKYFHPHREARIFMFLDLRNSTAIAEALGETNYFNFLKETYRFATPSILAHKGEIYQYVGDEIVITWPVRRGADNQNCIKCFFSIKEALLGKTGYFKSNYGVIPVFKAGLHCGNVISGEIGIIKREIAFSGDVLNTASRIQNKCNEMNVDLLFSGNLVKLFDTMNAPLDGISLGSFPLRGKSGNIDLFTL